ncbi:hypothetical protein CEXT_525011 [Caerostris extrusa]|uniref:Uncharacterized protein n=1 Tax=Caerostris extrusa TaxID=172846 RepID=A0AAV4R6F7_CAEEX|nr:hypothetical protein CEXT_525011 [Caerostris extrusa]
MLSEAHQTADNGFHYPLEIAGMEAAHPLLSGTALSAAVKTENGVMIRCRKMNHFSVKQSRYFGEWTKIAVHWLMHSFSCD